MSSQGPWDVGLQPERNALAWQRTGLAVAAGGLVALRDAVATSAAVGVVCAVVALAAGAVVLRCARSELDHRVAALRAGLPLPAPVAGPAATVGVLALCLAVLVLLLG